MRNPRRVFVRREGEAGEGQAPAEGREAQGGLRLRVGGPS